jgi:hypothetical protein
MPKTMFENVIVEHFRTHHKGHMPSPTSNCQKIKVNEASRHHTTIGFSSRGELIGMCHIHIGQDNAQFNVENSFWHSKELNQISPYGI